MHQGFGECLLSLFFRMNSMSFCAENIVFRNYMLCSVMSSHFINFIPNDNFFLSLHFHCVSNSIKAKVQCHTRSDWISNIRCIHPSVGISGYCNYTRKWDPLWFLIRGENDPSKRYRMEPFQFYGYFIAVGKQLALNSRRKDTYIKHSAHRYESRLLADRMFSS